jgi:haloacetate dehalogenase
MLLRNNHRHTGMDLCDELVGLAGNNRAGAYPLSRFGIFPVLHGFPETWYCWRHQIPVLAEKFRVIVPVLRGYGGTEKPASGYDKRTMANDIRALLQHLEIEKISMIGHDRGARVATRFAKDHPAMLDRLVVMDNIPTRIIFQRMNAEVARGHWFFIFNNVLDLPEALISGREEVWLRHIFSSWCYNPQLFSGEEIAEYVRAYSQPGALRGAFNDYRAGPEDVVQDEEDEAVLIECPTFVSLGRRVRHRRQDVGLSFDLERDGARSIVSLAVPLWSPSA